MKGRPTVLAIIVLVGVLMLISPARADVDVTLDVSGAPGGPATNQTGPQIPARTGFDPLPLGGIAMLLIAVGSLGLAKQKVADREVAQ